MSLPPPFQIIPKPLITQIIKCEWAIGLLYPLYLALVVMKPLSESLTGSPLPPGLPGNPGDPGGPVH